MPLPKRSKLISKRFKKPTCINPTITPPSPLSSKKTPSPSPVPAAHRHLHDPCREWRIRVICTDPDATDDSSSDEADDADPCSPSPSIARKRLIHEISLPLPSSVPSPTFYTSRARHTRSLCRDLVNPQPQNSTHFEDAANFHPASLCPPSPSKDCRVTEEEFRRFLSEFLPEQEDGCIWDCDLGQSGVQQETNLAEMLDLELDSEALSWINSMQRLP